MDTGVDIYKVTIFILFMVLSPKIECQIWLQPTPPAMPPPILQPSPLCASQFALANHACSMLPYTPVPPPSPTTPGTSPTPVSPDSPDSPPSPSHRHRHRHSHHSPPTQTPVEQECCRWLQEIDSGCVCEMLVRLPTFLAKPVHQYTVMVASCTVTYTCSGRIMSP